MGNKNAGFIILLTSIFTFFFFGEIRNLTTFTRLMDYNNGFSISSFFFSLLSFLWIGAQFPQEKFLSYGRILTLHYYFLLMCILFSLIFLSFISFFYLFLVLIFLAFPFFIFLSNYGGVTYYQSIISNFLGLIICNFINRILVNYYNHWNGTTIKKKNKGRDPM